MSFNNAGELALTEVNKWELIKKQVVLKHEMYRGTVLLIIIAQILGVVLSLFAGGASYEVGGGGESLVHISFTYIDGQTAFVFPLLALIGFSFSLGLKQGKNVMASYISNGITNMLANSFYLFLLAVGLGISSYVLMTITKLLIFQVTAADQLMIIEMPSLNEFFMGCLAAIFYALLWSMLAYFLGEVYSFNIPLFIVILVFAFLLMSFEGITGIDVIREKMMQFIWREEQMGLFMIKIIGIYAVFFILNLFMVQKEEVRR